MIFVTINEDILLTQKLLMCGKIIGIEVVDHIVIGFQGHVSIRKRIEK